MTRVASLLVAFALLTPAALADDTFDLRALLNRHPAAGARYRVTTSEHGMMEQKMTRQGQPPRNESHETQPAQAYVEQVDAVGADGEPTSSKRTYESFKDDEGKDVAVAGVIVTMTRTEGAAGAQATRSFAAAEGSKPIPPALQADLQKSVDKDNAQAQKHVSDAQVTEALFPAEAQAAGGTWTIDMPHVVTALGMDAGDLDLTKCTGSGSVEGVEGDVVKAKVVLTLMLTRMQGQPLPPTPMTLTLGFQVSTAADSLTLQRDAVQNLDLNITPGPGMNVSVKIHHEQTERRAAP